MKYIITITARMKSVRLPLKVLRYVAGKHLLEHQIERLQCSKLANEIVLCTSTNPQDEILVDIAEKLNIPYFRGSEEDVLARLYGAAQAHDADYIIGVTADNPLVDFGYIDRAIELFQKTSADYITCYSLPLGAETHSMKVSSLARVMEMKKESNTECWGCFFEDSSEFNVQELPVDDDVRHPEVRLTVDLPEDLLLIKEVFARLYQGKNDFSLQEIVQYILSDPKVFAINSDVGRRKHQIPKADR